MENELIVDVIKTGFQAIKEEKENQKISEQKDIVKNTENALLNEKKAIVKKYIQKKVKDPIIQLTGVAEDYLIHENIWDKIKDKFVFEKFLEKSNLEIQTLEEMKNLRKALENAKTETNLQQIENDFLQETNNKEEKTEESTENWKEAVPEKENIPEETSGNFDTLPENYKTYINKISSKFPDPKKSHIKTYGPVVIQEALKHDETKKIISKIFAQINKESWRNPNALNDKGEYSIGFMQINKNAGHTGKINGKYYDLKKPEENIAYGISFLAECIRRSNGNIRRWLNIYNGWANLSKPEEKQYAHSIMNDKIFNEKLVA